MPSRFELSITEIRSCFAGPFPLDAYSIEAFVDPLPGIYIWRVKTEANREYGYVGKSKKLSSRLRSWAKGVHADAQFYFKYVPLSSLTSIENSWISKAGDINER